jgi:uncharacterized protein YjbI with pentapeptide repeats
VKVNGHLLTSGANLPALKMQEQQLAGVDLSNAVLTNADFRGSDLSGANFTGADLSGADFRTLETERVDSSDMNRMIEHPYPDEGGMSFDDVLRSATYTHRQKTVLTGVIWDEATLTGAMFDLDQDPRTSGTE